MFAVVSQPSQDQPVLTECPAPSVTTGEVLVRVIASSVNPVDVFTSTAQGRQAFNLSGTVGLGWDVAGVVEESPVGGPTVGTLVAGIHTDLSRPTAGHAERVTLPVEAVVPVPAGLDPVAAATVPLNSLTAHQALDLLAVQEPGTLLVTGAAGAVGGYALVLAAQRGWQVTGLARESDGEFVERLGAGPVTDYEPASFDAVLDTAALGGQAMAAVRDNGRYVGVMPPFPTPAERGVRASEVMVRADAAELGHLLDQAALGQLPLRVAGEHPATPEGIRAAYAALAAPGSRGRQLIRWSER